MEHPSTASQPRLVCSPVLSFQQSHAAELHCEQVGTGQCRCAEGGRVGKELPYPFPQLGTSLKAFASYTQAC